MRDIRYKAYIAEYMDSVRVLAGLQDAEGHFFKVAKPVELDLVDHEYGRYIAQPTFELKMDSAQSLLDALLEAGLHPSKTVNPTGEIKRMDDHLQDMRRLVFKDLA